MPTPSSWRSRSSISIRPRSVSFSAMPMKPRGLLPSRSTTAIGLLRRAGRLKSALSTDAEGSDPRTGPRIRSSPLLQCPLRYVLFAFIFETDNKMPQFLRDLRPAAHSRSQRAPSRAGTPRVGERDRSPSLRRTRKPPPVDESLRERLKRFGFTFELDAITVPGQTGRFIPLDSLRGAARLASLRSYCGIFQQ